MTTVAAVLAAGTGTRFGGTDRKQHTLLGGRPVVTHSVAALVRHDRVDQVWVVGAEDDLERLRSVCGDGVARYVAGGVTRTDSVAHLVAALDDEVERVLVHDAARPLLPREVVGRVLDALDVADAVATTVPLQDTVVAVDGADGIAPLDRSALRALQTPQGFRAIALRRAFSALTELDEPPSFTDDVSTVAHLVPWASVAMVDGDPRLHKITRPLDLAIVEALLSL